MANEDDVKDTTATEPPPASDQGDGGGNGEPQGEEAPETASSDA